MLRISRRSGAALCLRFVAEWHGQGAGQLRRQGAAARPADADHVKLCAEERNRKAGRY